MPRAGEQGLLDDAASAIASKRHGAATPTAFEVLDEGRYRMTVPMVRSVLEIDYLRRERGDLRGELLVRCGLPGALTYGGVLSVDNLNLSSSRTRTTHARYLAERSQAQDADWTGILEELAQRVLSAERNGMPPTRLAALPRPPAEEALNVDGFVLLGRHPVILFGDGGTAKSYLALYAAGTLAQRGRRVAMFDWELSGEDHRDRLERLFDPMPDIVYVRCSRPLVYEADRLRRIVRDEQIDYAVFDSVAFACDGPPESAEVASKYFQSMRQLGALGSLHVAHVTKAKDDADYKPFGSVFWHNGARAAWNIKIADKLPNSHVISVALHCRKANMGAVYPSAGFQFHFGIDETLVRSIGLSEVPDLAATLPVRQRMALALRSGSMTTNQIAEEIEADAQTVQRTARRYKDQFTILDGGVVGLLDPGRLGP